MNVANCRGQILIPGLAIFLGLLVLLLVFISFGTRTLAQMRMDTAAQAAALSAARAEAQILNNAATHNLALDLFVPLVYTGLDLGVTELSVKDSLDAWYFEENGKSLVAQLGGNRAYPVTVGNQVARLNGAQKVQHWPLIIDTQLIQRDLNVAFLNGYYPAREKEYDNVYYVRTWKPDQRRAQPPHTMSWWVRRGSAAAVGSAHVYLDVRNGTEHNGGFPSTNEEVWEELDVQSFYPQFNGRLIVSPALTKLWAIFNAS